MAAEAAGRADETAATADAQTVSGAGQDLKHDGQSTGGTLELPWLVRVQHSTLLTLSSVASIQL